MTVRGSKGRTQLENKAEDKKMNQSIHTDRQTDRQRNAATAVQKTDRHTDRLADLSRTDSLIEVVFVAVHPHFRHAHAVPDDVVALGPRDGAAGAKNVTHVRTWRQQDASVTHPHLYDTTVTQPHLRHPHVAPQDGVAC